MITLGLCMYILAVTGAYAVLSSGAPTTRLGALVAAGVRDDLPPYVPRPYRRTDDWVLCVVSAGSGRYESPGTADRPVVAPALILVPPATRHWYGTDHGRPWTETWAVVRGPLMDVLGGDATLRGGTVRELTDAARRTRRVRELLARPVRGSADAERQLQDLFAWVTVAVPADPGRFTAPVRAAMERLGADLGAELLMPDVARAVGLGYDSFRRMFADEVGLSPLAYRSRRRLEAAANLLRTTDLTTHAVARSLGFTDEFYLSRRFNAEFGISPSRYRRSHTQG